MKALVVAPQPFFNYRGTPFSVYYRFLGPVSIGPSALKLFLDMFLVMRLFWLLLRNRYDVVHAHEEAVFFCALLKPLFHFKMIYDMHSSLPQ